MVRLLSVIQFLILSAGCAEAHAWDFSGKLEYRIMFESAKQGIDPQLGYSIAKIESGLNPKAKGSKGEIGLFQIMPYNAPTVSLYDVNTNIHVGVSILKKYSLQCADMGQYWVICYNNGVSRRPKYPNLNPYYRKLLAEMR